MIVAEERRGASWLLLVLFFASGFAALLYQIIWQRLLTLFGGADVYSVTVIVSVFMAGLGLGSLTGGHLADRLPPRARLLAFAAAELAIALFAFASVPLLHDVLYPRLVSLDLSRLTTAAVLFATLLWPTFCMGLSLPLLAKAASLVDHRPAEWIGSLYGVNTLGAAVGSLVTVLVLVRALGFERTVQLGASLNLACAAGGLFLAFAWAPGPAHDGEASPSSRTTHELAIAPPTTFSFRVWAVLYMLCGFVSLSLEVLWFRVLGVVLKSNSFTFGILLALYLSGVGGGALLAKRWSRRVTTAGPAFLLLQSGIGLYAGLSLALFANAVHTDALSFLWRYLGDYEALDLGAALHGIGLLAVGAAAQPARDAAWLFLAVYLGVPFFLIGIPTLFMGACFTLLQRATQTDPSLVGRRLGWLQTSNIVGSTLGTVVTGLALLQARGSPGTLKLMVALSGVFLVLWVRARSGGDLRKLGPGAAAAVSVVAVVVALSPGAATLWPSLHGASADRVIVGEDASGLSVLKDHPRPEIATSVFVNGLGQSQVPYGGGHTRLGMLPVLLHPHPRSLAIIGLGSGDTVFAAGGRQETERIDCIEIIRPQLETLRSLDRRRIYPGLTALLEDPRVHYSFTDGRAFVARMSRSYDVIEADALRPTSAYAGNLYSREYFDLIRSRLAPGGLGVTWGPTPRICDTFLSVFPNVLRFGDILIGSEGPIAFDRAALQARLDDPFTQAYYRRAGIDPAQQLHAFLVAGPTVYGPGIDRSSLTDLNTDLFPKDEYGVPQSLGEYRIAQR